MDEITGNMQSFLDELDMVYKSIREEDKVGLWLLGYILGKEHFIFYFFSSCV